MTPPHEPIIEQADSSLTEDCAKPIDVGVASLNQSQTEGYWSKDRSNLIKCGDRHAAHVDFIEERDSGLTNVTK